MSLKTFVANIGAGDALTPYNDLFYRIYGSADNYTTPISTTGSHVTDANVVVANGIVTIAGIEVGSNNSFKIVSVNQQAFEAPLSDVFVSSIIIFEDDFAGVSIDTAKWNFVNPNTGAGMTISQNDALIFSRAQATSTPAITDYVISKVGLSGANDFAMTFDVISLQADKVAHNYWFGLTGDAVFDTRDWHIEMAQQSGLALNKITYTTDGVNDGSFDFTDSLEVTSTFKLFYDASALTVYFSEWNGSGWTLIDSQVVSASISQTWYPYFSMANNLTTIEDDLKINKVRLSNADFSTQYPV